MFWFVQHSYTRTLTFRNSASSLSCFKLEDHCQQRSNQTYDQGVKSIFITGIIYIVTGCSDSRSFSGITCCSSSCSSSWSFSWSSFKLYIPQGVLSPVMYQWNLLYFKTLSSQLISIVWYSSSQRSSEISMLYQFCIVIVSLTPSSLYSKWLALK